MQEGAAADRGLLLPPSVPSSPASSLAAPSLPILGPNSAPPGLSPGPLLVGESSGIPAEVEDHYDGSSVFNEDEIMDLI